MKIIVSKYSLLFPKMFAKSDQFLHSLRLQYAFAHRSQTLHRKMGCFPAKPQPKETYKLTISVRGICEQVAF